MEMELPITSILVLALECSTLKNLTDPCEQFLSCKWLGDVIRRAVLERADRILNLARPRDHHHRHIRTPSARDREHLEPIRMRHLQIEQHQPEVRIEFVDRDLAVFCLETFMPDRFECLRDKLPEEWIVIRNQDGLFHRLNHLSRSEACRSAHS